jgi:sugar lactone lactonase YvrE
MPAIYFRPSSVSAWLTAAIMIASAGCSNDGASEGRSNPPKAGKITLLAGSPGGPGTIDGPGTQARFTFPSGIVRDAAGNFLITDATVGTLRKVSPDLNVSLYAGVPTELGHVDGSLSASRFKNPSALVMDAGGNLFVSDSDNHVIRRISADGNVTTFAGTAGEEGDADGVGSAARFRIPDGITIDGAGNMYVVDAGSSVIRKITPAGVVSTYAGSPNEVGAEDGNRADARFMFPKGILSDAAGNLWVADTGGNTIRYITKEGVVSTLAGNKDASGLSDGEGTAATFNGPRGLARDSAGNLYVADGLNNAIRKVTADGVVSTIIGFQGFDGSTDGALSEARFSYPAALLVEETGASVVLYVCDTANGTLRKIDLAGGRVTTLAGRAPEYGVADGQGSDAFFYILSGMLTDNDGNLVVSDEHNHTLRKITPEGRVTTWIGSPGTSGIDEGTGANALLNEPIGLAKDKSGNIYVTAVGSNRIHKITPAGESTVFAGTDIFRGDSYQDGPRLTAKFDGPTGLAFDSQENLFVADSRNFLIRRIDKSGEVTTVAGSFAAPGFRDGVGENARFFNPYAMAVDAQDNVWVADRLNHAIRKISRVDSHWMVKTIAGGPLTVEETPSIPGFRDGPGTEARFAHPLGIVFDPDGNLLVADFGNSLVRKVTPEGVVSTIVGTPGRFGVAFTELPGTILEPTSLAWLGPKKLAIAYATGVLAVDLP